MNPSKEQMDSVIACVADELRALKRLAREDHERRTMGKMTTCARCACGAAVGGPVVGDACRAVEHVREFFEQLEVDGLPEHQRMWAGVLKAAFRF